MLLSWLYLGRAAGQDRADGNLARYRNRRLIVTLYLNDFDDLRYFRLAPFGSVPWSWETVSMASKLGPFWSFRLIRLCLSRIWHLSFFRSFTLTIVSSNGYESRNYIRYELVSVYGTIHQGHILGVFLQHQSDIIPLRRCFRLIKSLCWESWYSVHKAGSDRSLTVCLGI